MCDFKNDQADLYVTGLGHLNFDSVSYLDIRIYSHVKRFLMAHGPPYPELDMGHGQYSKGGSP